MRNIEGGQACELVAWDQPGASDAGMLGEKSNSNAAGLKALLLDGDDSLAAFRRGLERRQLISPGRKPCASSAPRRRPAPSRALPSRATAPDRRRSRRADAGRRPRYGDAALRHRAARPHPARRASRNCPIRSPIRCSICASNRRRRESYFVKAGDYLQIIDVDGRQCTDFQCFSARKLDKGRTIRST